MSRHGSACLRLAHVDLLEPSVDGVAREITHEVAVPAKGATDVVVELAVHAQVERLASPRLAHRERSARLRKT